MFYQRALIFLGLQNLTKACTSNVWLRSDIQLIIPGKIPSHIIKLFYLYCIFQAYDHIVNFHPAKHTCDSWLLCFPHHSLENTHTCSYTHTNAHKNLHNSTPSTLLGTPDAPLKNNYSPLVLLFSSPTVNLECHLINSLFYWSQPIPSIACQT